MAAVLVVEVREVGKLPLQVGGPPEERLVEVLLPQRADEALGEWVRQGHVGQRLDLVDAEDASVRLPAVEGEQWVVVGAESGWLTPIATVGPGRTRWRVGFT